MSEIEFSPFKSSVITDIADIFSASLVYFTTPYL